MSHCTGCCEEKIAALEAENAALGGRLDMANEDWASDDTEIRDLCRPIIGEREADGDSLGVTPLTAVVEKSIAALKADRLALEVAILDWWSGFRPSKWTAEQHVEHPHVNTATERQKALASVASDLTRRVIAEEAGKEKPCTTD